MTPSVSGLKTYANMYLKQKQDESKDNNL